MADLVRRDTLLMRPTPRERAIGEANAAVVEVDHDIIRRAGSPDIQEVPVEYLPERAEYRSVDVWNSLWPESIKRAAIEAAPAIHRHKGTVYAVKSTLAVLGMRTQIEEWWQMLPRGVPYTFRVTAFATLRFERAGPLITRELTQAALAGVKASSPLSRAFEFRIGVEIERPTAAAVAGSAYGLTTPTVRARAFKRPRGDAAAAVAGSAYGLSTPSVRARAATGMSAPVCGTFAGRVFALTPVRASARALTAMGVGSAGAVAGSAYALAAAAVPARSLTGTSAQAGARAAGRGVVFVTARMDAT